MKCAQKKGALPMVSYGPCGSGKTETLKAVALSLCLKYDELKIVIALPHNLVLAYMIE